MYTTISALSTSVVYLDTRLAACLLGAMNTRPLPKPVSPAPSAWWHYGPILLYTMATVGLLLWQGCGAEPTAEHGEVYEPAPACEAPQPEQISAVIWCAVAEDCEEPLDPCRERDCSAGKCRFPAAPEGSACLDGRACLDGLCCEVK